MNREKVKNIEEIIDYIPAIPEDTNYWLVRANGGQYYEDFLIGGFIAVNTEKVSLNMLSGSKNNLVGITLQNYKDTFTKILNDNNKNNITNLANRTHKFTHKIKNNDIILVPGKKSNRFLIGIAGNIYNVEDPLELDFDGNEKRELCPYNIRREVQWLKTVTLEEMDDKLLWIRSAHQTILELKNSDIFIDPLIFPFYFKDKKFYANYSVTTKSDITVSTWKKFQDTLDNNLGEASNNTILKQNVQSPGHFLTEVPWHLAIPVIKAVVPVSMALFAGMGFSKMNVKVGDQEFKGGLTTLFYRRDIKNYIKEDILRKEEERKSIEIDNQLKRNSLQQAQSSHSTVTEEVPEMGIVIRNSGTVLPFRTRQNSNDPLDEGRP